VHLVQPPTDNEIRLHELNFHILELKSHHSLKYCSFIGSGHTKMIFNTIPRLTSESYIESCYVVNYNSLRILRDFDPKNLAIVEELLMITYMIRQNIEVKNIHEVVIVECDDWNK
jgi:hypothetical protein